MDQDFQTIFGWKLGEKDAGGLVIHPPVSWAGKLPSALADLPCPDNPSPVYETRCFVHAHYVVVHHRYPNGGHFHILDPAGREIWTVSSGNTHDLLSLILSTVMALVSRLRGRLTLHGAAVDIGGRIIALLGDSGTGKSTTSLALLRRDHAMMSDDIVSVCVESGFTVHAGLPQTRQTITTLQSFGIAPDDYPPLFRSLPLQEQDKRVIPLGSEGTLRFRQATGELDTVYVLCRDDAAEEVEFSSLDGVQALRTLKQHISFEPYSIRSDDFRMLGQLIGKVPIRLIRYPSGLAQIDQLCKALERDLPVSLAQDSKT